MSLRILIADDHGLMRAGLRALLNEETNFEIVGEAATTEEAVEAALKLKPDVVLMDLSMPGAGGIDATRRLKEHLPGARVLILTVHEDGRLLREAVKAGAVGYIVKRAVESELVMALGAVQRGELYVHPFMTRALLEDDPAPPAPSPHGPETLTRRETEILRLVVRGYTNRQIADDLGVSVRTVETHRANFMGKLGLMNRAEIVRWAAEHGLKD